jgi:hypothetical protein
MGRTRGGRRGCSPIPNRSGADRDRRHLDGRLRGAQPGADIPGPLLRRGRALGGALADGGETAAGSFDDEADFERNDVLGAAAANPAVYGERSVWLDVGREDPFRPAVQELAATLEAGGANLEARTWEGGHESSYWADHWDEYLRFYAAALERCPTGGV